MFIKPLYDDNQFDIFLGNGWSNWLRVQVGNSVRDTKVLSKAEHVEPSDKLKELIYFKVRKYQR
jgi:hypothetical protein